MSAADEPLEGIKAYKGTIESAAQTLSFLITFIWEGEKMWQRNWVTGMCMRDRETLLSLQIQKKRERKGLMHLTQVFFLLRKIAHCLNFFQKPIRRYLNCFFLTPPNSPPTPTHSPWLPAKTMLSIGGILAAGADCWDGRRGRHY